MINLNKCCDNCVYYPRYSSDRDEQYQVFKCEKIDIKIKKDDAINYICDNYCENMYLKNLRKHNFREVNNETEN